jgi:hypothetical protein
MMKEEWIVTTMKQNKSVAICDYDKQNKSVAICDYDKQNKSLAINDQDIPQRLT